MNFKDDVKESFSRLKNEMKELKDNLHSWVLLLKREQSDLKIRVYELEKRIRVLESQGIIKIQK